MFWSRAENQRVHSVPNSKYLAAYNVSMTQDNSGTDVVESRKKLTHWCNASGVTDSSVTELVMFSRNTAHGCLFDDLPRSKINWSVGDCMATYHGTLVCARRPVSPMPLVNLTTWWFIAEDRTWTDWKWKLEHHCPGGGAGQWKKLSIGKKLFFSFSRGFHKFWNFTRPK